jgi:hypothetical protein
MGDRDFQPKTANIVNLHRTDRWQVFHRLQALDISCQCGTHQPLLVQIENPQAAIQLWSVVKQCSASRGELIDWLNRCWQMK